MTLEFTLMNNVYLLQIVFFFLYHFTVLLGYLSLNNILFIKKIKIASINLFVLERGNCATVGEVSVRR